MTPFLKGYLVERLRVSDEVNMLRSPGIFEMSSCVSIGSFGANV
jgi:hypothetical protein